jgi:hypothetical protein
VTPEGPALSASEKDFPQNRKDTGYNSNNFLRLLGAAENSPAAAEGFFSRPVLRQVSGGR